MGGGAHISGARTERRVSQPRRLRTRRIPRRVPTTTSVRSRACQLSGPMLDAANSSAVASWFHEYSTRSATWLACASPTLSAMMASAMSMPAATPLEVRKRPCGPSWTQRASGTQFTAGCMRSTMRKASLLLVARMPSRAPAAASRKDPVQTVMTWSACAAALANHCSIAGRTDSRRVPAPPGTKSKSTCAAQSSDRPTTSTLNRGPLLLLTFASSAIVVSENRPGWNRFATANISSGPNTSSSSKSSKRTRPIRSVPFAAASAGSRNVQSMEALSQNGSLLGSTVARYSMF
mmetsp:Transcript_15529/g.39119  ORF Transcript_15529/g.39119 Transcript_15529/m.39119 type:complete len:292 (+) Transcript_15529:178-1053(+)